MPRLGWEDTLAYLTIPVILVATQVLGFRAYPNPHPNPNPNPP